MSEVVSDSVRSVDIGPHNNAETRSVFDLPVSIPLAVDLDGTLISGNMLYESVLAAWLNPLVMLSSPVWLWRGRAVLKRELALRTQVDWDRINLHQDVLALILREKAAGRLVVLATAADALLAEQVAERLGLFDAVIASDGNNNLKGAAKARALKELFPAGFIYAGDSKSDLPVWREASAIVAVGAKPQIVAALRALRRPMLELRGRTSR